MTASEFAEFLGIAKEAGVESFEIEGLRVSFKPRAPEPVQSFPRRPQRQLSADDWQFAATEGLPADDEIGADQ